MSDGSWQSGPASEQIAAEAKMAEPKSAKSRHKHWGICPECGNVYRCGVRGKMLYHKRRGRAGINDPHCGGSGKFRREVSVDPGRPATRKMQRPVVNDCDDDKITVERLESVGFTRVGNTLFSWQYGYSCGTRKTVDIWIGENPSVLLCGYAPFPHVTTWSRFLVLLSLLKPEE